MTNLWITLVRWRTYVVNGVLALMFILPEVLNSPEFLAIIPAEYQRWFLVAAFLLNVAMRPRPAALPQEAKARRAADYPHENL